MMKLKFPRNKNKSRGFTIIEVMIVLTIGVFFVLAVFYAYSQYQTSKRDHDRKAYLRLVYQSFNEFVKNNKRVPSCISALGKCTFGNSGATSTQAKHLLDSYMPEGVRDPLTGELYLGSAASNCGSGNVCSGNTLFRFESSPTNHATAAPAVGEVRIYAVHWCYSTKPDSGPASNAIASNNTDPEHLNVEKFALLIGTEKGRFFCMDNYAEGG